MFRLAPLTNKSPKNVVLPLRKLYQALGVIECDTTGMLDLFRTCVTPQRILSDRHACTEGYMLTRRVVAPSK